MTGKKQLAEDPTPAKSLLADPGDTECIPDTPDEASASKAVYASSPAVHGPPVQSITALDDAHAMAPQPQAGAVLPSSATTTSPRFCQVLPPPHHPASRPASVSTARRMVPESPDQEGPFHVSSPQGIANQLLSCSGLPQQEAVAVYAPHVDQLPSKPNSQSLHLSLSMPSSGAVNPQPSDPPQAQPQAQPVAEPQAQPQAQPAKEVLPLAGMQQSEVVPAQYTAVLAAYAGTLETAAAVLLSAQVGTAVKSSSHSASTLGQATVLPVRSTGSDAVPAAVTSSRLADTAAADLEAAPHREAHAAADEATVTRKEADAAADESVATPASSRRAHARAVGSAGATTGSPMNDSALMAALDSAERKFMQVLNHAEHSRLLSLQEVWVCIQWSCSLWFYWHELCENIRDTGRLLLE